MEKIYADTGAMLQLGRAGESGVRQVVFDLSGWAAELGPGHAALAVVLPKDDRCWPIPVEERDNRAVWTVTAAETSRSGDGWAQLSYLVDGKVAKTRVYDTWVEASLDSPTESEPPEPQQGWVDRVLASGVQAQTAAEAANRSRLAAQLAEGTAKGYVEAAREQADRAKEQAGAAAKALIADGELRTDKVLSGLGAARLLGAAFEEKGRLVSCQPLAGYPLEVVSRIDAPEGVSGLKLTRCGRNLVNGTFHVGEGFSKPAVDFGQSVRLDAITVSFRCRNVQYQQDGQALVALWGGTPKYLVWTNFGNFVPGDTIEGTVSASAEAVDFARLHFMGEGYSLISGEVTEGMVTVGAKAVPYEPYRGDAYTVDFGRKVQSGTYNWTTGVLTVEGPAPETIQLGPAVIPALSGVNNIYTDRGEVTVRGVCRADLPLVGRIETLEAAVLNLGGRA